MTEGKPSIGRNVWAKVEVGPRNWVEDQIQEEVGSLAFSRIFDKTYWTVIDRAGHIVWDMLKGVVFDE